MKASRKLNRRSFFGSVLGGVVAGGGATMLVTGRAEAQNMRYSGVTDADTGEHADRPGYGIGTRNRYTDQDTGPNADRQFDGRGPNAGRRHDLGHRALRRSGVGLLGQRRRAGRRTRAAAASAATARPRRAIIRPAIRGTAPIRTGGRGPIRCSRGGAAEPGGAHERIGFAGAGAAGRRVRKRDGGGIDAADVRRARGRRGGERGRGGRGGGRGGRGRDGGGRRGRGRGRGEGLHGGLCGRPAGRGPRGDRRSLQPARRLAGRQRAEELRDLGGDPGLLCGPALVAPGQLRLARARI